jgi:hypothetical protein
VRLSQDGLSATILPTWYQPRMIDDDECGPVGGLNGRGNAGTQRKAALMPFYTPYLM